MKQPHTKPNAMSAMGANRAAEQRAAQMADLMEVCHASAVRIGELTELVGDLRERLAALEGKTA